MPTMVAPGELVSRETSRSTFDAVGYDYGRWGKPPPPPVVVGEPVILIPMPSQLAAGQRVIEPPADRVPANAAKYAEQLTEAGYTVRLSWSLCVLPVGWGSMRHTKPKKREAVLVRVRETARVRGWAAYYDGAAADAWLDGRTVNVTTFYESLLRGAVDNGVSSS